MLHQMNEPKSESVTLLSLACFDLGAVLGDLHLAAVVGRSSSSLDWALALIMSSTSIFLPISREQIRCVVPSQSSNFP